MSFVAYRSSRRDELDVRLVDRKKTESLHCSIIEACKNGSVIRMWLFTRSNSFRAIAVLYQPAHSCTQLHLTRGLCRSKVGVFLALGGFLGLSSALGGVFAALAWICLSIYTSPVPLCLLL